MQAGGRYWKSEYFKGHGAGGSIENLNLCQKVWYGFCRVGFTQDKHFKG